MGQTTTQGDTSLRIMGWNVNSLSDYKTQDKFINKLKGSQENVIILFDTCLNCDSQRVFGKLWGEGAYFNSFSSSQRGLTILMKDSLPARDVKVENIIKGNYCLKLRTLQY